MRRSFGGSLALLILFLLGACSFFVIPIPIPRAPPRAVPATDATVTAASEAPEDDR
jgi:hypothetical protein